MLSSWGTWHLRLGPPQDLRTLSYQYFCCLRYISSFMVGCVNMWCCSGIKTLTSHAGTFFFFHCILKDEILARRIGWGCWPHTNYTRATHKPTVSDCTEINEINNPKRWQQDDVCHVGRSVLQPTCTDDSGSADRPFLIPVCTLEPAFRSVSTTPLWQQARSICDYQFCV